MERHETDSRNVQLNIVHKKQFTWRDVWEDGFLVHNFKKDNKIKTHKITLNRDKQYIDIAVKKVICDNIQHNW